MIRVVARREIAERVAQRAFRISTAITVLLVAAAAVVPSLLDDDGPKRYVLGVTSSEGRAVAEIARQQAPQLDVTAQLRQVAPERERALLEDGTLDAVVAPGRLLTQEEPDDDLAALVASANRTFWAASALSEAGASAETLRDRAYRPPPLRASAVEPVEEDADARKAAAYVAALVLYMQLIVYAMMVASGVVAEKSTRIVELLLSAIRPWQLLAGKVLGIGALALAQLLLVVGVGAGAAVAAGTIDPDPDFLVGAGLSLAWFALGYAFYACAAAVAGAIVPRQEELQSSSAPITMLMVVSFLLCFPALDDPDGTIALVGSYLPSAAPMVMPVRMVQGAASLPEVIASAALVIAATAALIPLAARIYAGAILRTRGRVSLRDAWTGTS